jgi:hypothetical protein
MNIKLKNECSEGLAEVSKKSSFESMKPRRGKLLSSFAVSVRISGLFYKFQKNFKKLLGIIFRSHASNSKSSTGTKNKKQKSFERIVHSRSRVHACI